MSWGDVRTPSPAAATFAAFACVLAGIGFARFAYTPLMPALVEAGWVSPAGAGWAGAANLVGYLAGALLGPAIARRPDLRPWLRGMMVLTVVSLAASAAPLGLAWLELWRFGAGVAGGALMVVGPTAALAAIPPERRGRASGVVFTGVGLGIALSGFALPWLLSHGLVATWLALAAACALLAAASWRGWPARPVAAPPRPQAAPAFLPVHLAYALSAIALVPHMVFLIDHVARGLGRGVTEGALLWALFGLGALCGPMAAGWLVDRIGPVAAMRSVFAAEAVLIAVPAVTGAMLPITVSAVAVGAFVPGVAPLVLGRLYALGGGTGAWAAATIGFSIGQAGAAMAFSALYAALGTHAPIFAIGAAALAAAVAVDIALSRRRSPPTSPRPPAP